MLLENMTSTDSFFPRFIFYYPPSLQSFSSCVFRRIQFYLRKYVNYQNGEIKKSRLQKNIVFVQSKNDRSKQRQFGKEGLRLLKESSYVNCRAFHAASFCVFCFLKLLTKAWKNSVQSTTTESFLLVVVEKKRYTIPQESIRHRHLKFCTQSSICLGFTTV